MGISAAIMKSMIKEVDKNGDGTIELKEWTDYLKQSREHNLVDQRGAEQSNILLDFIDNQNGSKAAMQRKKNVNLHDDQVLNEIEMQDAITIATHTEYKIRKSESVQLNQG